MPRHFQDAAFPTRRLIRLPRPGSVSGQHHQPETGGADLEISPSASLPILGVCLFAVAIVLQAKSAAAQDNFLDRWNLHGPAEVADSRQKSMLSPMQDDERGVSDEMTRSNSVHARFQPDFDLADFTTDFGESPRQVDRTAAFREETPARFDAVHEPFSEPDESIEAPLISEGFLRVLPGQPALLPEAVFSDAPARSSRSEQWQVLPSGLLYHSYLAGEKESRMQFLHLYDTRNDQTYWEATLGGRMGLLRHGTVGAINPEGFQLDIEGAVFARVLPNEPSAELAASDYRAGLLGTWRRDRTAYKAGFYHISSHVGDEFLLTNPLFNRINYVRDSLVAGTAYELDLSSKIYGEIAYAIGSQGGAEALELQFGAEYTPAARSSLRGAPFAAVNGHLREDFDFRGGVNLASGWGWQGFATQHRLRLGLQYYNGPSLQYQFFDRWENLIGGGLWMDY